MTHSERIRRYCTVGFLGFVLNMAITFCLQFVISLPMAMTIAFICAGQFTFFVNALNTWRDRPTHAWMQTAVRWSLFVAGNTFFAYVVNRNVAAALLATTWWHDEAPWVQIGWHAAAYGLTMLSVFPLNYSWNHYVVFRRCNVVMVLSEFVEEGDHL